MIKIGLRVLRVHQWMKNLLLFIPMFAAHQLNDVNTWTLLILAFFAFSFCASSAYILNDLLDVKNDRLHPRKRFRPFAAKQLPVWQGILAIPILLLISFSLGYHIGSPFLIFLACYYVVTCAYSLKLKRLILIDCITLALLYTLRIIAGSTVSHSSLSFWFLAFSVFLFLSLAFVKRYAELYNCEGKTHGRGYHADDAPLIRTLGVNSGFAAVLVLALYINSTAVIKLYQTPEFIWGTVPVILFWVSWVWTQAHRGKMHDDPLVFALKDPISLVTGCVFAIILLTGTLY